MVEELAERVVPATLTWTMSWFYTDLNPMFSSYRRQSKKSGVFCTIFCALVTSLFCAGSQFGSRSLGNELPDQASSPPEWVKDLKSADANVRRSAQDSALAKGWDALFDLSNAALGEDRTISNAASDLLHKIMATQPKAPQLRDFEALVALAAHSTDVEVSEWAYYHLLRQRVDVKSPQAKAALEKIRKSPDQTCAWLASGMLAPESKLDWLFTTLVQKKQIGGEIRETLQKIDAFSKLPDPVSKMNADSMAEHLLQLEDRARKLEKKITAYKALIEKWGKKSIGASP